MTTEQDLLRLAALVHADASRVRGEVQEAKKEVAGVWARLRDTEIDAWFVEHTAERLERALLDRHHEPKRRKVTTTIVIGNAVLTFEGDYMATLKPDDSPPFRLKINFTDARGQQTSDSDPVVWASDHPEILSVAQLASDQDQADVTVTGTSGTAQISATVGDLNAGGFVILGSYTIVAGKAVGGSFVEVPSTPPPDAP